jgi:glucose/arabinose dehydrogenase
MGVTPRDARRICLTSAQAFCSYYLLRANISLALQPTSKNQSGNIMVKKWMNNASARSAMAISCAVLTFGLAGCGSLADFRDENKGIQLDTLKTAPGFKVTAYATDLPKARQMAMGSRGTLFVGSNAGNVYALTTSGSSVTQQRIILSDIVSPSGVAFYQGALYVSARTKILRYDDIENRLNNPPAPTTVIDGLPDKERHGAHYMAFGPDGKFYVSVGSPCDLCEAQNDEFGTIIRTNPDGSGKEIVARGIRNSVGFDWHPQTRELWFTEQGQDNLGPDKPQEKLNRVSRVGENFGFPYCHDGTVANPEFANKRACSEFTPPVFGLGAHTSALGMRFYVGNAVPSEYQGSIIVTRHGSHPPSRVGYDVVRVVMKDNRAERMEPFLTGFLQGRRYWGRLADVLVLADGSVLISDDLNGAIYRVAR